MSTQAVSSPYSEDDPFQSALPLHYRSILSSFRKVCKSFAFFNGLFLLIGLLELSSFCFLLPLNESAVIAIVLSILFLTLFSYFVLLFYFQAKKPEQIDDLIQKFISSCQSSLGGSSDLTSHHLHVAEALYKLSQYLTDYESKLLPTTEQATQLSRLVSFFSRKMYWKDVFNFKQQLLRAAIAEHLRQIRLTPTDLELHASLANVYVAISQIYQEPKEQETGSRLRFYKKHAALFQEKWKLYGNLAIEEFQILNHYAPNDPWIHEQLASGFRALSMPHEEIREVELLLKLRPNDREVLFLLGTLYFEQGLNAKGLRIYEELKQIGFLNAENLIATYTTAR